MGLGASMAGGNPAEGRQPRDFYATPSDVTKALIAVEKFDGGIYDPACGDDAMTDVFKDAGYKTIGSDIHPLGKGYKRDFFAVKNKMYNWNIVTNPPFNLAEEFIEHALSLEPKSVSFVLKSSYFHAKSRKTLFDRTKPAAIYPLTWRPDFLGKGRPTMEVIWVVWKRGYNGPTIYQPLERP
jgi:hypothetical protein